MELAIYEDSQQWPDRAGLKPKVSLTTNSKPFSEYCQINAKHDLEAVQCWLQRYKDNPNTYKTYHKETRKFLLWCVYERGLTLSALKAQDFEQYFEFLKNPPVHWYLAADEFSRGTKKTLASFKRPFI